MKNTIQEFTKEKVIEENSFLYEKLEQMAVRNKGLADAILMLEAELEKAKREIAFIKDFA